MSRQVHGEHETGIHVGRRRYVLVKRAVDFVVAAVGLAVLSPLLVLVSIAALASQGRPLFFAQQRLGLRGEPFQIRKFRTMQRDTPPPGQIGQVTPETPS